MRFKRVKQVFPCKAEAKRAAELKAVNGRGRLGFAGRLSACTECPHSTLCAVILQFHLHHGLMGPDVTTCPMNSTVTFAAPRGSRCLHDQNTPEIAQ